MTRPGPTCPDWLADPELAWPEADWSAACEAAAASGDDRPTWAYPWPAGERLGRDVPQLLTETGRKPSAVIDLGCGRGYLGMQAKLVTEASVRWSDGSPHPLLWIDGVIAANRWTAAETVCGPWGEAVAGGAADLILGGDILYRPECFDDLLSTIAASLAPDGVAWLSDPRTQLEAELPALAASAGLGWEATRQSDYTLVSITPSV